MNNQGIQSYFQFKNVNWPDMWSATWETIWMTVVSIAIVAILGLLLGLLLFETSGSDKLSVKILNVIVGVFVNIFRSIPFIILIVLLLPLTQVLVGSITGAKAGIPALVIGASPMYARLVEIAFHEVDKGVIEAAVAMGANKWQILYKVLIPESLPALVSGITVSTIALIGYIAMAGAIGAGGVIDIGDCAGNGTSKKSIAPVVGYSSSLSNRNDDNIRDSSLNVRSSSIKSSSLDADGKVIIINPGPGPVIIPSSKSSTSMSSLSTSSENESVHRCSSYSSSGVSKNQSKRTSAIMCSSSALSSLSVKSSKLKIPKESSRKNAPIRSKKQTTKRAVRQASQPMVDQNGNLHLNPQQVRTLKHEMHFSNSKAAKAVKKMNKAAALHGASHESVKASNPSKQGLTLKHRNAAHPVSNVRRVTLPIQGILPATRMDPYTWVYSLVGLAIMIVSGRAFFSKKRK